jgi:hypothetical protein
LDSVVAGEEIELTWASGGNKYSYYNILILKEFLEYGSDLWGVL